MGKTYTAVARASCAVLFLLCLVKQAQCAHILGFPSMNYVSHHRVVLKIGKELQARGHKYTHILPDFAKETYDDVDIRTFNSTLTENELEDWWLSVSNVIDFSENIFSLLELVIKVVPQNLQLFQRFCEDFLKHESLIAELKESVDLVLCDVTNDCCFILVDMLNATRVDVSTIGFGTLLGAYLFGYPHAPLYATLEASLALPKASKFSFICRLKGFVTYTLVSNALTRATLVDLWEKNGKANSKFTHVKHARKVHGIALIPNDFTLEHSYPLGANIKVIGAILPEPARALPDYLDEFMTENKVVVLVSFGTVFSNYPTGVAQAIADELSQISAAVLWKYSGITPKNLGRNIKIIPWLPQNECSFNDLLGHSSTKAFITHGGLNSVQESLYHAVPMVVIPMIPDQPKHASLVEYRGVGKAVEWKSIIAGGKVLQRAVNEILNNEVYGENLKRISAIMKDRRRKPAEEGADWVEYALRHNGASHLISEAFDLPDYKLHMFDVFIFLVLVVFLAVYAILCLCCCFCRSCRRRKGQVKEKQG